MTVVFIGTSERLAGAFVPEQVRHSSLTYVRISSVLALSSTIETAVSSCTRALDHPDVPLVISSTKFLVNILLDMLVVSKFHVGSFSPTVNTQAIVRLVCDMTSSLCGLIYFIYIAHQMRRKTELEGSAASAAPTLLALKVLARPSIYTFVESALRNALYLWLVAGIISMSTDYATAWGIFNTIRWGLVMVPVQALQTSTLTFVGHNWGQWRSQTGAERRRPKASVKDIYGIFVLPGWQINLLIIMNSHLQTCSLVFYHLPHRRNSSLHFLIPVGDRRLCILPLSFFLRRSNHAEDVEGQYFRPLSNPPTLLTPPRP